MLVGPHTSAFEIKLCSSKGNRRAESCSANASRYSLSDWKNAEGSMLGDRESDLCRLTNAAFLAVCNLASVTHFLFLYSRTMTGHGVENVRPNV